jgi:hypothetical protein
VSNDLAAALAAGTGDTRPWAVATVLEVDVSGARVTVDLDGGPVQLRRLAGTYRPGDVVAVVRDPEGSGSGQFVAGIIGPATPLWLPGTVAAINAGTGRITVTVAGVSMVLPYVAGTYSVGGTVGVLMDRASGMGSLVLGPVNLPPTAPGVPDVPVTPTTPTTVAVDVPVRPTWSGTWRVARAAWDRWNTDSYGGHSDVYQGSGYGSGTLVGLATYGDQIAALGLLTLDSAVLTVQRNGSGGAAAVSVQCTASGSPPAGAPSSSGDVASSGSLSATGRAEISLTAPMREALRTGAAKGLVLVGAAYAGVFGTSKADGMALAITGTKSV